MLDWIFEGIVTWISSIVTDMMDAVSGLFLNALGTDMTVMEEYFPFVEKAFTVMQYTAWAMLFLITVWQLFRIFGGPITEAENPWTLLARSCLFALLIGYAKPIFTLALDIATAPYTALMDVNMTAEDFTFAGVGNALSNGLTTIISVVSVVGLLLLVILEIALGWNYFKLLLETVERYIVVGVLCYTSPLAYAMGASKTTSNVFKSWCHMVGTQLLLLIMNVWFLRAFSSSMGQFMGNGGALSTGQGSIFLWLFCALAFLKTAQKFDSYLASIGLNVAQTGSSMGMELLMAARVVSGIGSGSRSAGSVFRGGSAASGTGAASTGFAGGFASKFKGNSYVRDAVVNGGTRMGMGGTIGFVGRAFGGMAARGGATLNGDSISSVASRTSDVSGTIAGNIADRSLSNYMPHLAGQKLANTQISGGRISTTSVGSDGKNASVEMFNAAQYEKPDVPHSIVTASDGSQWYQMASGSGAGAFYSVPEFSGDASEASKVAETFPDAKDGTMLRTADEGVIEASSPGESSLLYNSAMYAEPEGPHSVVTDADGNEWYQMSADGIADGSITPPAFTGGDNVSFPEMGEDTSFTAVGDGVMEATGTDGNSMLYNSAMYAEPEGDYSIVTDADGNEWYRMSAEGIADGSVSAPVYTGGDGVSFPEMDSGTTFNAVGDGVREANAADGSSMLYNSAMYAEPEGEHSVVTDSDGNSWYQVSGTDAAPQYTGDNGVSFSSMPEGTEFYQNAGGIVETSGADGGSMLYNSATYAEPEGDHSVVTADDGSTWYQMSSADLASGTVSAPQYIGSSAEAPQGEVSFPEMAEGTTYTPTGNGVIEATGEPGNNTLWYSSANYEEPDAPHTVMQSANGVDWYAMQPHASSPEFEAGEAATAYNQAQFQSFMPGYETNISTVDGSTRQDGYFEVRNKDGSGTMFYDTAQYAAPRGDYQVFEDKNGSQWYAIHGNPAVERVPVYGKDGKPVYENEDTVKTKTVETVRYKNTPSRFKEPKRREKTEIKAPKRKR